MLTRINSNNNFKKEKLLQSLWFYHQYFTYIGNNKRKHKKIQVTTITVVTIIDSINKYYKDYNKDNNKDYNNKNDYCYCYDSFIKSL